ncbi:MAG: hypothetical protein L0154_31295 [Chloroflexi bacterium]|nr:hypothetical protein [Chloroflexota bacterium]
MSLAIPDSIQSTPARRLARPAGRSYSHLYRPAPAPAGQRFKLRSRPFPSGITIHTCQDARRGDELLEPAGVDALIGRTTDGDRADQPCACLTGNQRVELPFRQENRHTWLDVISQVETAFDIAATHLVVALLASGAADFDTPDCSISEPGDGNTARDLQPLDFFPLVIVAGDIPQTGPDDGIFRQTPLAFEVTPGAFAFSAPEGIHRLVSHLFSGLLPASIRGFGRRMKLGLLGATRLV